MQEHLVQRNGMRVVVAGDVSRLSAPLRAEVAALEARTAANSRALLIVCFAYTSRYELAGAARALASDCADGSLDPSALTEAHLESRLCSSVPGCPPLELLIRTSGERRLSDFLTWQTVRCPVLFANVRWPELSLGRFLLMILRFQITRRFLVADSTRRDAPPRSRSTRGTCHVDSSTADLGTSARLVDRERLRADRRAGLLLLLLGAGASASAAHAMLAPNGAAARGYSWLLACALAWLAVALFVMPSPAAEAIAPAAAPPAAHAAHAKEVMVAEVPLGPGVPAGRPRSSGG